MYYNRYPERNIGFIPQIHALLRELDNESLAMGPIQLNLKLDGGREMKDQETVVEETPKEVQSRSLLTYKVGRCPGCGIGDLWVTCKSKDDIEAHSGVCDYCGHVDVG